VFDRLAVVDYGDVNFDHGMPETVIGDIEKQIADIIKGGTATLCLGGDHFISYPVLRAQAAKHGPLALVHFDAHSDTWKDETPRIDHGNMFWHAANEGLIVPQQSVQVGLRTFNKDTHGFNWLKAACVHQQGVEKTIAEIRRVVGDRPCYLTFDIDCLDPAYAPGTGTPVIGGLSSWQAQHILRGLAGMNFVAMDLVEVAPIYDVGEITSVAGATLALESLYLYSAGPRFRERC
jgi:agmatinase